MMNSLRRVKVEKQSEISPVHIEIHQCHRFSLPRLLHCRRQIRGNRTCAYPTSCTDHAEDPSSLILNLRRSAFKSLLEPREGRFNVLTGQRLRKKLLDAHSKRLQEELGIRP